MKLSEAILLGDTLKKATPGTWISADGSCGCAFGGALLAVGVDVATFKREWVEYKQGEWPCVKAIWPWLTSEHLSEISRLYVEVYRGQKKIEDVVAYVRTIEPPEDGEDEEDTGILGTGDPYEMEHSQHGYQKA